MVLSDVDERKISTRRNLRFGIFIYMYANKKVVSGYKWSTKMVRRNQLTFWHGYGGKYVIDKGARSLLEYCMEVSA